MKLVSGSIVFMPIVMYWYKIMLMLDNSSEVSYPIYSYVM